MHKFTKKALAVSTAAALLLGGGAAYAYWTNTGSGTGNGTTGTNVGITVVQTNTSWDPAKLVPGGGTQPLSGTFTNTNAGTVWIKTVVATVTGTEKPLGTANPGCTAADYTIAGTSVINGAVGGAGAEVPAGILGTWSGLTIAFNNTGANQDACKSAVVTIGYTTTSTP